MTILLTAISLGHDFIYSLIIQGKSYTRDTYLHDLPDIDAICNKTGMPEMEQN